MRQYLFHLKYEGWIKECQWDKKHWNLSIFLFRLLLFALSLTSDMKKKQESECTGSTRITRKMKWNIKLKGRDYAISNMKNFWNFMMIFKTYSQEWVLSSWWRFKETIKVKHITLTPVKIMSCMNLLLSSCIAFSHIFISPWDFKLYFMMKL